MTPPHRPHLSRRDLIRAGAGAAALAGAGGTLLGTASPAAADPAAPADTGVGRTTIIGCADWKARQPSAPVTMDQNSTRKITVHHMAFPNVTDYSRAHAIKLAQDCQDLHMDTNGWIDTGQHFTVSRGGYVLEGRHRSLEALQNGREQVTGAHCVGENTQSIGIETEGTYTSIMPPAKQFAAVVDLCATVADRYRLPAHQIFGHWDWNFTDCPGAAYYRKFPTLRRRVAALTGLRHSDVPARTWPDIFTSSAGHTVWALQYLLRDQGYSKVVPGSVEKPGSFDAATLAAENDWQSAHGITPSSDGTVTDATWEGLCTPVGPGSSGDAVRAAQSVLSHKGYTVAISGTFDARTKTAVQQLQQLHGLAADGRVDTDTWCAVMGGIVQAEFRGL